MTSPLELHQVSFRYPEGAHVLNEVDFRLESGDLAALIGPNGCGKSTLLRLIVGPDAIGHLPYEGQVSVCGTASRAMKAKARARCISYVPQQVPHDLRLSVQEVVELGRFPHQSHRRGTPPDGTSVVASALKLCALDALQDRRYASLSGGERQRVILAGCIAQDTPVLLLDEPTSALDLHHALSAMEILQHQVQRGKTVLMASHDINLAAQYATRLLVLHKGKLVADGPPHEVLTQALLRQVYGVQAQLIPVANRKAPVVLPLRPVSPASLVS